MADKYKNLLGISDDSEDDSSQSEPDDTKAVPLQKKQRVDLKALEAAGYKSGPSVLFVPAPKEDGQSDWSWAKASSGLEGAEESYEERERTRAGANEAAEIAAREARLRLEQAEKLKAEARQEARDLAANRRLTFQQKV